MGGSDRRVVVVVPGDDDGALAWIASGAVVVVAGPDAGAVGAALSRLSAADGRVAGFVGDADDPGLSEMVAELFPGSERSDP